MRDQGLDDLRGLAVIGMVIVNLQGNSDAAYTQLVHAPWHGLTLADLVFPFFLVAVGMSAALVSQMAKAPSAGQVARRTLALFAIGVLLGWLLRPSMMIDQIRWVGVLQRIAIVYAAVAMLCMVSRRFQGPLLAAVVLMAIHAVLLFWPGAHSEIDTLARGEGLSGLSDRLLPGRLYRPDYDPEGMLSTLSSMASGMLGAAVWRLRNAMGGTRAANGVVAGLALVMIIAGSVIAAAGLPFNKALWTPSFALATTGIATALWLVLGTANPHGGRWTAGLGWLGQVALTLYVVHMLIVAALLIKPDGANRLWAQADGALTTLIGNAALSSLVFSFLAAALSIGITWALYRRQWLLKV